MSDITHNDASSITLGGVDNIDLGDRELITLNTNANAFSISELSQSQYAEKARKLIQITNNLRAMGAESIIDLPRVVVIGSTSVGKSSLIEFITQLPVPRDSSTCTRCPVEVSILHQEGEWSCHISLRFEEEAPYLFKDDELDSRSVTGRTVHHFGEPIHNKLDVELMLRRAQAAILNPTTPHDTFLTMDEDELSRYQSGDAFANGTKKFSKDTICLDIKDPRGVNLVFVDLPGLVQNDEPDVVAAVEDIVKTYIQGNCIILVVLFMADDIANQRAMKLANEADPARERTIGVLTKPDCLSDGSVYQAKKWKSILLSDSYSSTNPHALKYGYYCVKLPDDALREQNLSYAVLNQLAEEFFDTKTFWKDFPNRKKFGVPSMVEDLSKVLIEHIITILPKLQALAQAQLQDVDHLLHSLPAYTLPNPTVILSLISDFSQEIKQGIFGSGFTAFAASSSLTITSSKAFIQLNKQAYQTFKQNLQATTPYFRPVDNLEEYTTDMLKRFDLGENGGERDPRAIPKDFIGIRTIIAQSIGWELPHFLPFQAHATLIKEFVDLWDQPIVNCFEAVATNFLSFIKGLIQKVFGSYPNLEKEIRSSVTIHFTAQKSVALSTVKSELQMESFPLLEFNVDDYDEKRSLWMKRILDGWIHRDRSLHGRKTGIMSDSGTMFGEETKEVDLNASVHGGRKVGRDLEGESKYEDEMRVMADVKAYFELSYKRLANRIPQTIEHTLMQALSTKLQTVLMQEFNFGGQENGDRTPRSRSRLDRLLAEDPEIAVKRAEWMEKKQLCERIQEEVKQLEMD